MTLETLAVLSTGITVGVSVHSLMEPSNIRNRVRELNARLGGDPYTPPPQLPFAIDAAWKSLLFGMTLTLLVSALACGALWLAGPSVGLCLATIAIVLILKEAINTIQVNAYHSEIGKVIEGLPAERSDTEAP
ncbi:MAG: hypothetical protein AAF500_05960 [Myxococcota bacterium]